MGVRGRTISWVLAVTACGVGEPPNAGFSTGLGETSPSSSSAGSTSDDPGSATSDRGSSDIGGCVASAGGGELIALSSHPGLAQAAMAGISNHGMNSGCSMPGATRGDAAYRTPFGAFAWVEVPTDQPVTVVGASASNFGDQPFAGCNRGTVTQEPWVTTPPGAALGCVYLNDIQFEPGHHDLLRYGQITELSAPTPPADIVDAFARPEIGLDVTSPDACAL